MLTLTILFTILLIATVGNLIGFAVKMSWGLLKIVLAIVFWPILLVVMVIGGLLHIALPILIIIGIISLITTKTSVDQL